MSTPWAAEGRGQGMPVEGVGAGRDAGEGRGIWGTCVVMLRAASVFRVDARAMYSRQQQGSAVRRSGAEHCALDIAGFKAHLSRPWQDGCCLPLWRRQIL